MHAVGMSKTLSSNLLEILLFSGMNLSAFRVGYRHDTNSSFPDCKPEHIFGRGLGFRSQQDFSRMPKAGQQVNLPRLPSI